MRHLIKILIIFLVILFFVPVFVFSDPYLNKITKTIKLKDGELKYYITYKGNRDKWAEYIMQKSRDFLIAAEDYLGLNFPKMDVCQIKARDKIYYNDPDSKLQGIRIGGSNFAGYIGIEYDLSKMYNPALLFHELGHYWFGQIYLYGEEETTCLIEGVVSFLPVAMANLNFLTLDEKEYYSLFQHWGISWVEHADDPALQTDFRWQNNEERRSVYYLKTFKLQYYIYKELGKEKYKEFLIETLATSESEDNIDEIIIRLNKLKKTKWRKLLSGWLFPGKYKEVSPSSLYNRNIKGSNKDNAKNNS